MDDLFDVIISFFAFVFLACVALELVCFAATWVFGIALASVLLSGLSSLAAYLAYLVLALVLASKVLPVVLSFSAASLVSYLLIIHSHISVELVGLAKFHGIFSGPYEAPLWLNYSVLGIINLFSVVLVIVLMDEWMDKTSKRGTIRIHKAVWWLFEQVIYLLDQENRGPHKAAFRWFVVLVMVLIAWPVAALQTDFSLTHFIGALSSAVLSAGVIASVMISWRRMRALDELRVDVSWPKSRGARQGKQDIADAVF